jgi:hypothetical protein
MVDTFNESDWRILVSKTYTDPAKLERLIQDTPDPVLASRLAEAWLDDKRQAEITLHVLELVPWFLMLRGRKGEPHVSSTDAYLQLEHDGRCPLEHRDRVVHELLAWRKRLSAPECFKVDP